MRTKTGEETLRTSLEMAFLNKQLPQGTPLSPLITNVMMLPIDHKLSNIFRDYEKQKYIYTRYADDFLISSKYDFDIQKIEGVVSDTLSEFNAPFSINRKKTRYGSSAGRNWNLGVMLNKDNEITVGHKRKRQFQSMVYNYAMDRKNGIPWDKNDIMILSGYYSYYHMVEPATIEKIVTHIGEKVGSNIMEIIKHDLAV
jgi:hypothetical protein